MNYSIFPLKKEFLLCRPFHSDLSRNWVYNSHFSSPTASIYQNKLHCTPSRWIFSRRKDTFLLYLLIVAIFSMDLLNFHKKSICLCSVLKIKLFLALLLIVKTVSGGNFSACQLCIYWTVFKFLNFCLFPSNSVLDLQLYFRLDTKYLDKINDYIDFSMAETSLLQRLLGNVFFSQKWYWKE